MENSSFAHLHVHNEYSLLDGFGTAKTYAERAKELGFKHLALTNHGNIDGCIKFQRACDEAGIHSILGVEAYIVEDMSIKVKGDNKFHITLLAKDSVGWKNLLQLITYSNVQGFYRRPRIDSNLLLDYIDGIIVMTACCHGFIRMPGGKDVLYELAAKTDVFLEIMPVYMKAQSEMNKWLLDIHKESGIPLVATMDCHYPLKGQNELQEVLLAMQSRTKWNDPNRWKFDIDDLYLKTADEMIGSFKMLGGVPGNKVIEAMENTIVVAEMCTLHVDPIPVILPKVDVLQYRGLNEKEQLVQLVLDGLDKKAKKHKWITQDIDKYYERIDEELGLIFELNFERYFLIVWELIGWCKENDVFAGPGRGSVGGCLCAFLLEITSVDSLYWDLPFSRFISPARIDLPDIDMDFEDIKRNKIRKHLEDLYGKFNVTSLSTFSKLNGRSAIRDISRVFDLPYKDVDAAAKSIVVRSLGDFRASYTIEDAFNAFEDGINFKRKYPRVSRIAIAMEGQVKNAGKHAAAMCVAKSDLRSGDNISLSMRQGEPICSFDKYDAEHLGLMKLDVLGLNALTVLHGAKKMIKKRYGIDIDYEDIPFDDKEVLTEFTVGNTAGVFQFASHSMIKLCREIHTEDFEQVISLNALNRPGCLRSGMASDYKERKHGEKQIPKMHPMMARITKNTFGIVLFQEQIMYIMYDLAGLPWKTADMVRKVISKSTGEEQFMKFKQLFIDGCKKRETLSPEEAKSIFEELKHFGCLTGDTKMYRASANQHKGAEITVKEAFYYQKGNNFRWRGLKVLSRFDDGFVRPNTIKRIHDTGMKEVYWLRTVSNKNIRATADHWFYTFRGWRQLKDMKAGDLICTSNLEKPKQLWTDGRGSGPSGQKSPNKRAGEGYTNERAAQIQKLKEKYNGKCQVCGSKKFCEMHHIDSDHRNNTDKNTMWLCRSCHRYHTDSDLFKRYRIGHYTHYENIVEVKFIGSRQTYDVEMVDEPRNFIANNFISHNSYGFNRAHSVEYAMIAWWDMWLKVHYPVEFIVSLLSFGPEGEKKLEHVAEAKRLGLKLFLPDINKSDSKQWEADEKGNLLIPFCEIKGIGPAAGNAIVKHRGTELFKDKDDFVDRVPKRQVNSRVVTLLERAGAFDSSATLEMSEEKLDEISDLFDFDLSNDPMYRYKKMLKLMKMGIKLSKLINVTTKKDPSKKLYFGRILNVKFGYKEKVKDSKTGVDSSKGLGGVYGNFNDGTDFAMLTFNSDLYESKKNEIEHCAGQWLMARGSSPFKTDSVFADGVWFGDDLLKGEAEGLGLELAKESQHSDDFIRTLDNLSQCNSCGLRRECKAPVLPSLGQTNIMIVGEAPGLVEDRQGEGFVGDTGDLLFGKPKVKTVVTLEQRGIPRSLCYITNVVKCFPKRTRTPKAAHIRECSKWLEKEIEITKPFIILSFGNTGLKFFKGMDSGIMSLNGITEWNSKFNCWICYSVHPASVLYESSNASLLNEAFGNFVEKIGILGFGL